MLLYDHFYDEQMKRFLEQIVRAFSGFQYLTGRRGDKAPKLRVVPCTMAKRNAQVAMIQRNLSENTLNTVPMITVDHTGLTFNAERLQNPHHVGSVQVYERARDPITGQLTDQLGNSITVERLMPRPFTMQVQVDIWTSNQEQKHQLMEQILPVICPTFDIQNSDNPLDWSALTNVHVTDLTWTSVSVPIGDASTAIDIATIQLEVPMWLSPPAKVKRMRVIESVVTNINNGQYDAKGNLVSGETLSTEVTTPGDHHIEIAHGVVKLLGSKANEVGPDGEPYRWTDLFHQYSKALMPSQTQLRIRNSLDENAPEIIGRLQYGDDENLVEWQIDIDSLPSNTLAPVVAVIDPMKNFPGDGTLPVAAEGQRYLLIDDLPENNQAWGMVGARANAIMQYHNGEWTVPFSGMPTNTVQYVLNSKTARQLRWDGDNWTLAIDGTYAPGFWRII